MLIKTNMMTHNIENTASCAYYVLNRGLNEYMQVFFKHGTQSYMRQQIIKNKTGWPHLVFTTKKNKKNAQATWQLKAGAENKAGRDRKERTRDAHGRENRDENNGDKDFGDGVKRYKPGECWELCRLPPSWGVHAEAETLIQWELIS